MMAVLPVAMSARVQLATKEIKTGDYDERWEMKKRRSRTSYDQHLEEELLGGSLCLLCFSTGHLVLASWLLAI